MDASLNNYGDMGDALEDIVLSWTVSTAKDEQPVKMIPRAFCSTEEYLECYKVPLIEDTRSMVLTSLNSIQKCQYYKLLSISKEKNFSYFLDIDPFCEDGLSHVACNGDLFLLSTSEPKVLPKDNDAVFAMAIDTTPHEYICKSFYVIMKGDMRSKEFKYAIFLCNIMCNLRIWKTLHLDMGNNAIIKQILQAPLDKQGCDLCRKQAKESHLHDVLLNSDLDRAQQDIALLIASKVKCHHSQTVEILSGPPRTGKTKIISTVLEALKKSEANILVCAPTISSFSPLCSSMINSTSRRPKSHNVLPNERVGDAILLCDKADEVGTRSTEVLRFCIGYRLREIMTCMTWKNRIDTLVSFLEKGFREDAKKLEEKLNAKKEEKKFKEMMREKDVMLRFLRQVLQRKSSTLIHMLKTLWIHVPGHIFSKEVEKRMAALIHSLENLNSLLQNGDVTEEDVRYTFDLGRVKLSTSSQLKTSLSKSSPWKNVNANIVKEIRRAMDGCLKCLKYLGRHVTLLPFESDIDSVRKFLIQETRVIFTAPSNSFELHSLGRTIDILFVERSHHIRESELLIPLALLSPKHVILTGDESGLINTSKVNENSGFEISLYKRLISLGFQKNMMTTQYKTHPLISCLVGHSSASYISPNNLSFDLGNYTFINIDANKESTIICSLLGATIQEWKRHGGNTKLEIGVLCSWNEIEKVGHMQDEHGQLNVSIQSIHRIQEEKDFDVLIVSTCGFPTDDKRIRYALSKARDYLWIVGDKNNKTWEKFIDDAISHECFVEAKHQPKLFAAFEHEVDRTGNLDVLASTLGLIVSRLVQPAHEFTWVGRTYNGKPMLPPVRDQRGENHCTLCSSLGTVEFLNRFKCALLCPPSDFPVTLSKEKLLIKYNDVFIGIGEEEGDNGYGIKRLENVLWIIQTKGATSESDDKVVCMISSYERFYNSKEHEEITLLIAGQQLREGKVFVGTFKLSLNYIYYKPGDVYEFKPELPILAPLTNQASSHAVMIVGGPEASSKMPLEDCHFVMQNSQGTYFGQGGIGRVKGSSINNLYQVYL